MKYRIIQDDARVLGLALNGVQNAYPVAILNWHEVVNDKFDNLPVAITFLPLVRHRHGLRGTVGRDGARIRRKARLIERMKGALA